MMLLRRAPASLATFTAAAGLFSCTSRDEQPVVLYEFDCGVIELTGVAAFGLAEEETDVRELIVPCFIVEHPEGILLWDGGLPSSLAAEGGWIPLVEQLTTTGLSLDSLDYVAFSHMHDDHVGVANELTSGTLLIQRAEYEAAFADSVTVAFYRPDVYSGLRDMPHELLQGERDVFGDGRVRIIPAPGHTPGHQVLFVDLAGEGPVLLAGDLYHFRASRTGKRVPTFNVDSAMTVASMDRVEQLVAELGAELWIEHDMARFREHEGHLPAHR